MMRLLLDQRLEIISELLWPRDDRRRARLAQHADRLARHVVGDFQQRVEILCRAVAGGDALEDLRRPRRTFTTLCALRAALVREEARGARDEFHEILRVIDDDDAAGAEHRALR